MKNLHIELTNRCILACPACPRTEWANMLKRPVPKQDLDYLLLDKFLDCPGGAEISNFELCGDYGDCIYYPELLDFIKHFRTSKSFSIFTNGSRQTTKFWNELAGLLTDRDEITFAVDGLEEENQLYRKNSHWPSIMEAIDIIRQTPAKINWQTIVFKFNQHKLNEMRQFAESKGANFVQLSTHRYGDVSLIPDSSFMETAYVYKPDFHTKSFEIKPKCKSSDLIPTIGADGIFYPCDWMRNPRTFYKSELWKQKSRWLDKLNIATTNYDSARAVIEDWADSVKQNSLCGGHVDTLCKMKCRKELDDAGL